MANFRQRPPVLALAAAASTVALLWWLGSHVASRWAALDSPATLAARYRDQDATRGLPGYGRPRGNKSPCVSQARAFDDAYVAGLSRDMGPRSNASSARFRAVAYLARAALTDTDFGDFVEVVQAQDGVTALTLRVLRDFDTCGRRMWSLPERHGAEDGDVASDAFRLRTLYGACNATCELCEAPLLAFARLSTASFEQTAEALVRLYPRLRVGGYVYLDAYYASPATMRAVDAFRAANQVWEPLHPVDEDQHPRVVAAWWRRERR